MLVITHIRSVALGVTSIDQAREFYQDRWDLEEVASDADRLYLGAGSKEPFVLRLREVEEPRVDLVSFSATSREDVLAVAQRVEAHPQSRIIREPDARQDLGGGFGVWFMDPDGRCVEVSAELEERVFSPVAAQDTRPIGISHVVLNTPDIQRARSFYEAILGFRVTDWVEDIMCFLRTGPLHHIVAFTSAPHTSLNHVAFEVRGLDEFMRATGRMRRFGIEPLWGPGRHGVGNNTFSYFRDPNSPFVLEYTTDAQVIDEATWEPGVYPATAQTSDQWGTANARDDLVSGALRGTPDLGAWIAPPV